MKKALLLVAGAFLIVAVSSFAGYILYTQTHPVQVVPPTQSTDAVENNVNENGIVLDDIEAGAPADNNVKDDPVDTETPLDVEPVGEQAPAEPQEPAVPEVPADTPQQEPEPQEPASPPVPDENGFYDYPVPKQYQDTAMGSKFVIPEGQDASGWTYESITNPQ